VRRSPISRRNRSMDDQDDRLRELAGEYNQPPETPREAMWQRIVAQRKNPAEPPNPTEGPEDSGPSTRVLPFRFRSVRPVRVAAGIAAILAIGIGLGRLTVHPAAPAKAPVTVAATSPHTNTAAYRLVTTEHLSQSEEFLTLFRASVRGQRDERLASATARQLLASNRLLLDSPAADDAPTRLLLQDLELVLAEIAQLSSSPKSHDLDLITEGIEQGGVLSRLRTAVPAGTSPTQGSL
jgi:hypothetical protein